MGNEADKVLDSLDFDTKESIDIGKFEAALALAEKQIANKQSVDWETVGKFLLPALQQLGQIGIEVLRRKALKED